MEECFMQLILLTNSLTSLIMPFHINLSEILPIVFFHPSGHQSERHGMLGVSGAVHSYHQCIVTQQPIRMILKQVLKKCSVTFQGFNTSWG